jgi:hypothetical protein
MSISASKFSSVYWRLFFRIGTFQRVTNDSKKNSLRLSPHGPGVQRAAPSYACLAYLTIPRPWRSVTSQLRLLKYIIHLIWIVEKNLSKNLRVNANAKLPPPRHSAPELGRLKMDWANAPGTSRAGRSRGTELAALRREARRCVLATARAFDGLTASARGR